MNEQITATVMIHHIDRSSAKLSAFDISVLQWLSFGKRIDEVAQILGATENAMKQRIFRIKNKLGANTSAGAVGIAFRTGLIK